MPHTTVVQDVAIYYRVTLPLEELAKHGFEVTFADAGDRKAPQAGHHQRDLTEKATT